MGLNDPKWFQRYWNRHDHGAGSFPTTTSYLLLSHPPPMAGGRRGGWNVGRGSAPTFTGQLAAIMHAVYTLPAPFTAHSP